MPVLDWRPTARADPLAFIDYISDDNIEAALRLRDEIEAKAAMLPEHPKLYRPGRVAGTREMVVVYAEDAATVTVLRVLHTAQRWPLP